MPPPPASPLLSPCAPRTSAAATACCGAFVEWALCLLPFCYSLLFMFLELWVPPTSPAPHPHHPEKKTLVKTHKHGILSHLIAPPCPCPRPLARLPRGMAQCMAPVRLALLCLHSFPTSRHLAVARPAWKPACPSPSSPPPPLRLSPLPSTVLHPTVHPRLCLLFQPFALLACATRSHACPTQPDSAPAHPPTPPAAFSPRPTHVQSSLACDALPRPSCVSLGWLLGSARPPSRACCSLTTISKSRVWSVDRPPGRSPPCHHGRISAAYLPTHPACGSGLRAQPNAPFTPLPHPITYCRLPQAAS